MVAVDEDDSVTSLAQVHFLLKITMLAAMSDDRHLSVKMNSSRQRRAAKIVEMEIEAREARIALSAMADDRCLRVKMQTSRQRRAAEIVEKEIEARIAFLELEQSQLLGAIKVLQLLELEQSAALSGS